MPLFYQPIHFTFAVLYETSFQALLQKQSSIIIMHIMGDSNLCF